MPRYYLTNIENSINYILVTPGVKLHVAYFYFGPDFIKLSPFFKRVTMVCTTTYNTRSFNLHNEYKFSLSLRKDNNYLGILNYSLNKGLLINSANWLLIAEAAQPFDEKYCAVEVLVEELMPSAFVHQQDALLLFDKDILEASDYEAGYIKRNFALDIPAELLIIGASLSLNNLETLNNDEFILTFPELNYFCNTNCESQMYSNNLANNKIIYKASDNKFTVAIAPNITKEQLSLINSSLNMFTFENSPTLASEFYQAFTNLIRKYGVTHIIKQYEYVIKINQITSLSNAITKINNIELVFNTLLQFPVFFSAITIKTHTNRQYYIFKSPRCFIDYSVNSGIRLAPVPFELLLQNIDSNQIDFDYISKNLNQYFPDYTDFINKMETGRPSEIVLNHFYNQLYNWFEIIRPAKRKDKWQFLEEELIDSIDLNDLKITLHGLAKAYLANNNDEQYLFGKTFYGIRNLIVHPNDNKIKLKPINYKLKIIFIRIMMALINGYILRKFVKVEVEFIDHYIVGQIEKVCIDVEQKLY